MSVIEFFETQTIQRPWGEETLIADTPLYNGRVLRQNAASTGRFEVDRDRTAHLYKGQGLVDYDSGEGQRLRVSMNEGMSFRFLPGSFYSFEARTDCVVFETSTPRLGAETSGEAMEQFVLTTKGQSWGEEILVAQSPLYTGKRLHRYTWGKRGGLQNHPHRDETFYLEEGQALVYCVDDQDLVRSYPMRVGESFHVPIGAIHSVQTLTDTVMFEASHPIAGNLPPRMRFEESYDISQAVEWRP